MKCKHCGAEIRPCGQLYVADLSLADKATMIRNNSWDMDEYRMAAVHCGFDTWSENCKVHEPSEASIIKSILKNYGIKDWSGLD